MFKRKLTLLILIIPLFTHAQKWEVGFQMGGTNYLGDLAPEIVLSETNMASGLFFKKNVNPFLSHAFGIMQGQISAHDNNFKHLEVRNLSFSSSILEFSYLFEFNFFPFGLGLHPNKFTPYSFIGAAGFIYQPKTLYNGDFIKLHGLDTEGIHIESNKNAYSLYQFAIPIGGGFKIKLNKSINVSVNVGFRYTFTDYLDDVSTTYYNIDVLENIYGPIASELSDRSENSIGLAGKQRGRPDLIDWYIFSGLTLSFQIRNKVCFEF
ncbi:MAG: hypothetical protein ISR55_01670 [Bacteroidetes bacterium]|nr:hypothetical protein [Bacteroidota bacterium]